MAAFHGSAEVGSGFNLSLTCLQVRLDSSGLAHGSAGVGSGFDSARRIALGVGANFAPDHHGR
jgi:hypothetical protein